MNPQKCFMSCFICSGGVQRRPSDRYDQIHNPQRKEVWTVWQRIRRYVVGSEKNDSVLAIFCTLIETRMHSSRMRTVHCSGRLSCHSCSPPHPHHACPSCHTHPLSCMPPPTHAPSHAYTLPCTPPPPWTDRHL